ncbi:hypothetical protein E2C01_094938 [Portunus trituberculatus]|uniref:Uncharacterized protein n=1 Tax=Portunus trituberculatus TaxID=210409 RepID=A0A5B7JXH2_PORTR|nr:hypothetical protein [Portunus trituberculatus]
MLIGRIQLAGRAPIGQARPESYLLFSGASVIVEISTGRGTAGVADLGRGRPAPPRSKGKISKSNEKHTRSHGLSSLSSAAEGRRRPAHHYFPFIVASQELMEAVCVKKVLHVLH